MSWEFILCQASCWGTDAASKSEEVRGQMTKYNIKWNEMKADGGAKTTVHSGDGGQILIQESGWTSQRRWQCRERRFWIGFLW